MDNELYDREYSVFIRGRYLKRMSHINNIRVEMRRRGLHRVPFLNFFFGQGIEVNCRTYHNPRNPGLSIDISAVGGNGENNGKAKEVWETISSLDGDGLSEKLA